jgi:hypothetical protein
MLNELIFLGQIPGTNFQITFYDIVESLLLITALYLCWRVYWLEKQARLASIKTESPQNRRSTPPAQLIGRIGLVLAADSAAQPSEPFVFPIPSNA